MKKITRGALIVALLSSVSACTTGLPFGKSTTPVDNANWDSAAAEQIDLQLAEAAERAADANETLAQVERTRTAPQEPAISHEAISQLPSELQRPTTVNWTGTAADLTGEIARNIGYSYAVTGPEPSVPIMVSISATDEPAVKVLEDIGYQVAQFGEIHVDPDMKRLEFRYHSDMVADNAAPSYGAPSLNKAPAVKRSTPTVTKRDKLK